MVTKHSTHFILAGLLLLVLSFSLGCADGMLGAGDGEPLARQAEAGKFRNAHLIDRAIRGSEGAGKGATAGGDRLGLVVSLKPTLTPQRLLERYRVLDRFRLLERYEFEHVFNGLAVEVLDSLGVGDFDAFIQLLMQDPDILWFEPDIDMEHLSPQGQGSTGSMPWGLVAIGGGQLDKREAKSVAVFVVDSGTSNKRHLKLKQRYDVINNVLRDKEQHDDTDGHGTHVAGIIAAKKTGQGAEGVVQKAEPYSLKVVGPDGTSELSTAIAAVEYVTGFKLSNPQTPVVVNMSLGAVVSEGENLSLDEAIEASLTTGVVYVVSAGNHGIDAAHVSPAHVPGVITVGAYGPDNRFASFSNYGALVDILAPGVDVPSLAVDPLGLDLPPAMMSGTSMAAGYVTGVVALFLQKYPQATPRQITESLQEGGLAVVENVPTGTTNKTVYIGAGGAMEMNLPPFFQYAITANGNIEFVDKVTIKLDSRDKANSNVFTNSNIDLKTLGTKVEGFGYAAGSVKPEAWAALAFSPRYNPTRLPVYQKVGKLALPDFKPQDYRHLATQFTDGDVELSGNYVLGTAEAPVVWYIKGSVKTHGDVTFSGYGIVMVESSFEAKHNVSTLSGNTDTNVGLYVGGNFKIKRDGDLFQDVDLVGQIFTAGTFEMEGNLNLTGSITALGSVKFKGNGLGTARSDIKFRPPSRTLTDLIWPLTSQRVAEAEDDAAAMRLLSRF